MINAFAFMAILMTSFFAWMIISAALIGKYARRNELELIFCSFLVWTALAFILIGKVFQ